jgi:dihydroneopterin aldolase
MIRLLASVRSPAEARAALAGGADLIDLKEPAAGALGRLPDVTIRAVLAAVAGQRPTSATIGDLPLQPAPVREAVLAMAATGVDIVKIGLFDGDRPATLRALPTTAECGARLVAVLFADRQPDLDDIARCAAAGFFGVMLDTADKAAGSLTHHLPAPAIAAFVGQARAQGLVVGLAGSLGLADVAPLTRFAPDYLGFRSVLTQGQRTAPIAAAAVARVRQSLTAATPGSPNAGRHVASWSRIATATAGAQSAAMEAASAGASMRSPKLR